MSCRQIHLPLAKLKVHARGWACQTLPPVCVHPWISTHPSSQRSPSDLEQHSTNPGEPMQPELIYIFPMYPPPTEKWLLSQGKTNGHDGNAEVSKWLLADLNQVKLGGCKQADSVPPPPPLNLLAVKFPVSNSHHRFSTGALN